MPKCYRIDLPSHTVDKWSNIYAIRSQIFEFLNLKKITSFFVKKLQFFHEKWYNFLQNQKLKNSVPDCVDNGLLVLCVEKNWNPSKIRYRNLAYAETSMILKLSSVLSWL